jgi:hypothetical protein
MQKLKKKLFWRTRKIESDNDTRKSYITVDLWVKLFVVRFSTDFHEKPRNNVKF